MIWDETGQMLITLPCEKDFMANVDENEFNRRIEICRTLSCKGLPPVVDGIALAWLCFFAQNSILEVIDHPDKSNRLQRYSQWIYAISNHTKAYYKPLTIPKKDGGKRFLFSPQGMLRRLQKCILFYFLEGQKVHPAATAYVKGGSVRRNALPHVGKPLVVKLDICNFFTSITQGAVLRLFMEMGYPAQVAMLLAKLCCFKGRLPQGACTSPALSNLICRKMDGRIAGYCAKRNIAYTRYADDMTFSGDFDSKALLWFIRKVLADEGFSLNVAKTKVLPQNCQQKVTGVVVNRVLQVDKKTRRKLRQEVYYITKYGVRSHIRHTGQRWRVIGRMSFVVRKIRRQQPGQKVRMSGNKYLQKLHGRLAYARFVRGGGYGAKDHSKTTVI